MKTTSLVAAKSS